MLSSVSAANNAVQESRLRLSRSDVSEVTNLAGRLTTVVGRVWLDTLRSRKSRAAGPRALPDPVVTRVVWTGQIPSSRNWWSTPSGSRCSLCSHARSRRSERLTLPHDIFALVFTEIAPIVVRQPTATRQLASRAGCRTPTVPDADLDQRDVVDASFAAAAAGASRRSSSTRM
jgi:RNA polymerase sigma-70 factor (ECF subfamily)